MRRAKPISVVVKAPTRGLVTRLPSLSADLMPTQSTEIQSTLLSTAAYQRAAASAQNVRYEDGVVCAAPGYLRINLSSELLQGIVAYWPLNEASGTRYDATPNYLNLTDVPGVIPSGGVLDVTSDAGIIGAAALFPTLPPIPPVLTVRDLLLMDSALASGFVNPLIVSPPRDLFTLDTALLSGTYFSSVLGPFSPPEDSLSFDGTVASGVYTETVIGPETVEDEFSFDGTMASGTYTLVIVVPPAPEDSLSLDGTMASGTYAETIIGPEDDVDKFSLDSALHSGSYS